MHVNQYKETVVKYCLAFVAAIVCYWLLYFLVSWSLYGVANLTDSKSLMHWLADKNYFEAAKESSLNESYIQTERLQELSNESNSDNDTYDVAEGIEYLNTHHAWIEDEMDSIQCLKGLFYDLNHFDLKKIQERKDLVKDVPLLEEIVRELVQLDKSGEKFTETYNLPGDNIIRPRIYIRLW